MLCAETYIEREKTKPGTCILRVEKPLQNCILTQTQPFKFAHFFLTLKYPLYRCICLHNCRCEIKTFFPFPGQSFFFLYAQFIRAYSLILFLITCVVSGALGSACDRKHFITSLFEFNAENSPGLMSERTNLGSNLIKQ